MAKELPHTPGAPKKKKKKKGEIELGVIFRVINEKKKNEILEIYIFLVTSTACGSSRARD